MLPKKRRLNAAQVREIITSGKSVRGGAVSLKYVVKQGYFGVAVVVPKSVARLAVARNTIRRAVYRAVSSSIGEGALIPHNLMVVFFVRAIPSPLSPAYTQEVVALLTKLLHTHV